MHVYMLLDRSGSMSDRWAEALGAINSYVADLAEGRFTRRRERSGTAREAPSTF
jgi:hypothetical protein